MEWIETLTGLQKAFFTVGLVGSLVFLIQFVLMLLGGDSDSDTDASAGGDMISDVPDGADSDIGDVFEGTAVDHVHADSDIGFKLLSIQSISVFFMMFGLVGLAVSKGGKYGSGISLLASFVVGFIFMYIVAKMFAFFRTLQNSGTMDINNALGQEARVYLTIRHNEPGQVEVVVQEHLTILTARSKDGSEIPTDTSVKVVGVKENILIVERVTPGGKD